MHNSCSFQAVATGQKTIGSCSNQNVMDCTAIVTFIGLFIYLFIVFVEMMRGILTHRRAIK